MSDTNYTAFVGLLGVLVGATASIFSVWFSHYLRRAATKSEMWHEKRIAALEKIYKAFGTYLDFLRRRLYVAGGGGSMDPYFDFNKEIEEQLVYLNHESALKIQQYQGELLLFWNSAMTRLSEQGERAREEIQRELDFDIPKYLPKIRSDIAWIVDPYRRRWWHRYRRDN